MNAVVTGDVHLGSRGLNVQPFIQFLQTFPDNGWLILNGDVVNRNCRHMPPEHAEAFDQLRQLSKRARVTWIRGNHDENYSLAEPANIEFVDFCLIEDGVAVLHGHDFRHSKLHNPFLVHTLRAIHAVRKYICSEPAYISFRIREKNLLVRILRRHIINNAFALAAEKELHTVICGHIHLPEQIEKNGRRYINTGTWLGGRTNIVTLPSA